jgi:hypothetical protein
LFTDSRRSTLVWREWTSGIDQGNLIEDVVVSAAAGASPKLEESLLALRSDWNSFISAEKRAACFHVITREGITLNIVAESAEMASTWVRANASHSTTCVRYMIAGERVDSFSRGS